MAYLQVITRPMDLGTVKEKVDKKLYNAKAMVLQDIDLVWNNALKFNPSGHEVHEAAAFLQKHTLGHCLKAMVVNQGSLTTVGSVPTTPLSRQVWSLTQVSTELYQWTVLTRCLTSLAGHLVSSKSPLRGVCKKCDAFTLLALF